MERGGERWEIVSLQVDLELLIRGQDRLGVRDYLGRRLVEPFDQRLLAGSEELPNPDEQLRREDRC
jgi:hypothetical protein